MESFKIHILGCGSALPTPKHYASSQVVEIRGKMFMIDCGEGTQIQLRRSRIKFQKISNVFISHLHGDHCFGLIGMVSTFGMLGRTAPLHVYAPADFENMLNAQIEMFCRGLEYEIVFHAVDTEKSYIVYEDRSLSVSTIPLKHRIPCCGYMFREKPILPHIRREMLDFYNIPLSRFNNIKNGEDWITEEGEVIKNSILTKPADPPRSYAYCSDTAYMPELWKIVKNVNVLYHESTYASDNEDMARMYYHSTSQQAAYVAKNADAGKLLLGHYSSRYANEDVLLDEAVKIFPNSVLSHEGQTIDVL